MTIKSSSKYKGGYIMILNTVLFIAIILTIVIGVANPVLSHYASAKSFLSSKQSYVTAHSGVEEVFYRLKNNLPLPASFTYSNGTSSSATITITTTANGKNIVAAATTDGYKRSVQLDTTVGDGISFHYGIQAGNGGFVMNGGSKIIGNVYSNGDIVATNGVSITGSAFAADSAAITADQTNDSPTTPPNSITFRDTSTTQDFAQALQITGSAPINKISLYIKKVGNPSDVSVKIVTDSSGSPSTNDILDNDATLSAALVGTSNFGWVDVVFPSNPQLTPGTTYWVVLDSSSNSTSNYYVLGANSSYANGNAKIGKYSSTWNATNPSGLDSYFRFYLGGLTSTIGGDTNTGGVKIGSAGVGDAWANKIQGATVAGHMYCQTSSYTSPSSCNTSQADPVAQPYPVSDANIQDWKNVAAAASTTIGNVTVDSTGAALGAEQIIGNLTVNGGGTLTVNGTIWVHGTLTLTGGAKIKLSSNYGTNSGVIVADGIVNLAGGGSLSGSGQTGSYIMILTTSNCPFGPSCGGNDALTLSGGAGAVVVNAQNGNMVLEGGSGVHEATAYQITATGGATITYDSGLANVNFSSGPGGGYSITDWLEI